MRILLLPLDERPCNAKFPSMVGRSGDVETAIPPRPMLGDKKTPADVSGLFGFLTEQAATADAAVVSLDMLVYGGLIPSRLHHMQPEVVLGRLNAVRTLKRINPRLAIYASMSVMRAPQYDSDDEEPDYYAHHGRALFRRAWLLDRAERGGLDAAQRAELDAIAIPDEVVEDYERRRRTNLLVNEACLDLLREGAIDFLVFPQDDSSPYGYTAVAQRHLQRAIEEKGVRRQVMVYPGSDEIGCTLLARAVCALHGRTPTIRPRFASTMGPGIIPLYEDRPMMESLKSHVRACGARLADSDETADIELMINAPGRIMQEAQLAADGRDLTYDTYRNLPAFVDDTARLLDRGSRVAICDSAYANGGDQQLLHDLDGIGALADIASYAGWNTNCNTLGNTLAQAIVGVPDSPYRSRNLAYRLIDDVLYQTDVRWRVDAGLSERGGSYQDVVPCMDWAVTATRKQLQKEYDGLALSATLPARINAVRFPWRRMFEIDMDLTVGIPSALRQDTCREDA